jgi:MraZ protein
MALFLSTFVNKIDKKGRISVPATFRAALSGESFQGIVAFRSYKHQAIEACSMERMQKLCASVDDLDFFSDKQDDLASTIFADALQLPLDGDGRIILPQILLDHAGISDSAAFVGRGATFQIWMPEAFAAFQDEARARVSEQQTTLKMSPNLHAVRHES